MVPLTKCMSGDASITTRLATSEVSAMRPRGIDRGRQLVRLLVAQAHVPGHGLHQAGPPFGAHRPRIHRGEADAVLSVLAGQGLGEVLAGRVGRSRRDPPSRMS